MAARFPRGKQPKFPVHCIGTIKLSKSVHSVREVTAWFFLFFFVSICKLFLNLLASCSYLITMATHTSSMNKWGGKKHPAKTSFTDCSTYNNQTKKMGIFSSTCKWKIYQGNDLKFMHVWTIKIISNLVLWLWNHEKVAERFYNYKNPNTHTQLASGRTEVTGSQSVYQQYTLIRSVLKTRVLVIPREHNNPRERSSMTKSTEKWT